MNKLLLLLIMTLIPTLNLEAADAIVEIVTTQGPVKVKLYDDTPLHKANFLKLAANGDFNGMLFHRVIKDFMVQTGDPNSKEEHPTMPLGSGQIGDDIPAEIIFPAHYNKYGALAAARDGNPEKKSSGSQFYIVTGRKFDRETAQEMVHNALMKPIMEKLIQEHKNQLDTIAATLGRDAVYEKIEELMQQAESQINEVPEQIVDDYVNSGGAPHLDGDYTVFGEVIEGMDVIDKIQNVRTNAEDRPLEDIRIISTEILSK